MELLGWEGLQKFWNKVKALVQPYVKDASLDGNTLTFTKGTGETKSFTIEGGSASNTPTYSEGLAYQTLTSDGSYVVAGIGTCTDTDIIIPSVHNGERVSGIKLQAFYNNTNITSVVIPNSVTYINKHAFNGCTSLASVVIPESVTTIGYYAFQNCTNLKIYCETSSKPSGWDAQWNASDRPVVWDAAMDILGLNDKIAECITETELDAKGYATEEYVDEKVSSISSGGTSSGDPSIIDLGEQPAHKDAQVNMINYLADAEEGCYLFKYWCSCYGNACFAVVRKSEGGVSGTVYDSTHSYRQFAYDIALGEYVTDGCWEDIGTSSGGAGLSMPRIRLSNWHYTELPRISFDENGMLGQCSGEIIFSVNIQDGTVQEGDQLQVCSIRNTFGKKKLRPILSKTITAEDIENLAKQPYLQVSTEDVSGNNLAQTTSQAIGCFYHTDSKDPYRPKPKYIRIRRPIYTEEGYVANAFFSNVVPVEIVLRYEIV